MSHLFIGDQQIIKEIDFYVLLRQFFLVFKILQNIAPQAAVLGTHLASQLKLEALTLAHVC